MTTWLQYVLPARVPRGDTIHVGVRRGRRQGRPAEAGTRVSWTAAERAEWIPQMEGELGIVKPGAFADLPHGAW